MLQLFVSTRVADVNDVLAAAVGAAIGIGLGAAFSGSEAVQTRTDSTSATPGAPALVEGRPLASPFLGVVAYLVLLTVTAFWPWAKVTCATMAGWSG